MSIPKGWRKVTRGRKRLGDRVWVSARTRGMRQGGWSAPIERRGYFYRAGDAIVPGVETVIRRVPAKRRRAK